MSIFKSGWFYVVGVLILTIVSGLIYHKCSIDSLKENNNKLLQQLLADSNYQTKQLTEMISGIKTIQTDQISGDLLSDKLKEQLDKYNLNTIYGAQIQIQASLNKVLDGQAGATTLIPRPPQQGSGTTTIVVRPPPNGNSNPNNPNAPVNPSIPPDNQPPTPESVTVCNECLATNIIRVPFSATEQFLSVNGWTESGPSINENGTYHLDISWLKDIALEIAIAEDEDGNWNTLINSNDPDVDISRIRSEINVSRFEQRWYQKIKFGVGIGFGETGALLNGGLGYAITKNFALLGNLWFVMPFQGEINWNQGAFYGLELIMNL